MAGNYPMVRLLSPLVVWCQQRTELFAGLLLRSSLLIYVAWLRGRGSETSTEKALVAVAFPTMRFGMRSPGSLVVRLPFRPIEVSTQY